MKQFWSAPLLALTLLPALFAETDAELVARAAALHARSFTIDTHIDIPTSSLRRVGWDITQRHEVATDYSQCDFPRMREGGLKAGVFVVFVEQRARTPEGYAAARDSALRSFMRVRAVTERYADQCGLALTAADGPRIFASGKRAIYLSIENGFAVGQDLTLLKTYHDLGARFLGFVHNGNTDLADSSQPGDKGAEWNGLSPLGQDAVKACNRLGLVIDGSHASDATVHQMIALSQAPIILTHSGCKAICDHKRNVPDDLLRELAAHGGVIQLNTVSDFVLKAAQNSELQAAIGKLFQRAASRVMTDAEESEVGIEFARLVREKATTRATLEDFLKHLFHAIEVAGVEHVGLGADMDGGGGVIGLDDVGDYPKITLALLKHGVSEGDVEKIWGGNTLRVLRAAEDFAKASKRGPAKS